ncbi:MAG: hypothetical protein R2710_07245 [Acidimicrobiales bacterium]
MIAGTREDRSGETLAECLERHGVAVVDRRQISDGVESVRGTLVAAADGFNGLIVPPVARVSGSVTSRRKELGSDRAGGAGAGRAMRLVSPNGLGRLSRAIAGTRAPRSSSTPPARPRARSRPSRRSSMSFRAVDLLAGGRPH